MKVKRFPAFLVQGFTALLPLIVTLYIGMFAFRFGENIFDNIIPLFPLPLQNNIAFVIIVEIIIFVLSLLGLALFGMLVHSIIGKGLLRLVKSIFSLIPGLNVVYRATEQVVSVITSDKKAFFNHPVLVEYPSPGIWVIGFNTGVIDTLNSLPKQRYYTIFIPTTPNPTSGFLAIMPEDKIRAFAISAEDAIKIILTGGIVKQGIKQPTETIENT